MTPAKIWPTELAHRYWHGGEGTILSSLCERVHNDAHVAGRGLRASWIEVQARYWGQYYNVALDCEVGRRSGLSYEPSDEVGEIELSNLAAAWAVEPWPYGYEEMAVAFACASQRG